MYCGSCLHDNALAKALIAQGHDALLVPTYTPILTDEVSVAREQLFYGGLNVYLQQVLPIARWIPKWSDRFLGSPRLTRWIATRAMGTTADKLGALTVSMLRGRDGNQRKEVDRLVDWLSSDIQPEAIIFSNLLIGGAIPEIKRRIAAYIVVILQGDDAFFDQLPEPFASQSLTLLRQLAHQVDLFLVHSRAYGLRMQERLGLRPDQWQVLPLGLDPTDFRGLSPERMTGNADRQLRVGYLARLAPEKGLHVLAAAFIELAIKMPQARLEIAGWLGKQHHAYWHSIQQQFAEAGVDDRVHYWGSVDRAGKLEFLRGLDVLSVPATHFEPKGLFVLEALAAGVPVVLPAHAAFPELIERLGGGVLVPPADTHALSDALFAILSDLPASQALGDEGRQRVLEHSTTAHEARQLVEKLKSLERTAA